MQDVPDVLSPTQPTIAELIEVVIDQFALMGASPAQLDASRLRLRRDRNAYFFSWVTQITEWFNGDLLAHVQTMHDTGYMEFLLGPDIEIE